MPCSCSVSGCHSGSLWDVRERVVRNIQRISLFSVPRLPIKRQVWNKILNQQFSVSAKICEFHFNESDIRKSEVLNIDGVPTEVYYLHKFLIRGAVPILLDESSINRINKLYRIIERSSMRLTTNKLVLYSDGCKRFKPIELVDYAKFCQAKLKAPKHNFMPNIISPTGSMESLWPWNTENDDTHAIKEENKEIEEIHVEEDGELVKYSIHMLNAENLNFSYADDEETASSEKPSYSDESPAMNFEQIFLDDPPLHSEQVSVETSSPFSSQIRRNVNAGSSDEDISKEKNSTMDVILKSLKSALPEGWTHFEKAASILFIYIDPNSFKKTIQLRCNSDMTIKASFKGRPEFILGEKIQSFHDLYKLLSEIHTLPLCAGTQFWNIFSPNCCGLIESSKFNESDENSCSSCLSLRSKLIAKHPYNTNIRPEERTNENDKIVEDSSNEKTDHEDHTYSNIHASEVITA